MVFLDMYHGIQCHHIYTTKYHGITVLSDIYQGITMLLIEISSKYYDNTMVFCEMPYQQNTIVQFWICILLLGYSISPSSHHIQKEQWYYYVFSDMTLLRYWLK